MMKLCDRDHPPIIFDSTYWADEYRPCPYCALYAKLADAINREAQRVTKP